MICEQNRETIGTLKVKNEDELIKVRQTFRVKRKAIKCKGILTNYLQHVK